MDTFISLAKEGLSSYTSGSDSHKTGGHEYNSPHHSGQDRHHAEEDEEYYNHHEVVRKAKDHGSGESSLFSGALDYMNGNKHKHEEPIDEEHIQEAHKAAYSERSSSNLSADSLGGAAALQALKRFTSGSGGGSGSSSDLISLAMAEASKLFDSSGGTSSGNKQDAVNSAGMTIMKLMVQSKLGGGGGGGIGGIMSMAAKFM